MIKNIFLICFSLLSFSTYAQEDCITAITICGNSGINFTPSGIGIFNENVGGCLSGEHHSAWYKFTIATSGTLTFDLTPTGPVDYDWAIYGPNKECSNLGSPIRCNASGYTSSTGMDMTSTNIFSGPGATSPYTIYMDVTAGESYYLYLDNWSPNVHSFNLTWGGTATFVSPFTDSSITPNPFIAPGSPNLNPSLPNEISICDTTIPFDFTNLTPTILNGNLNFIIKYYENANDATTDSNPITTPIIITSGNTYFYNIIYQDPNDINSSLNKCKQTGSFIFKIETTTPIIWASSNTICNNETITLTSNTPTGNIWSTGETTQTIHVNSEGTYSLSNTNNFCISTPTTITITKTINPNIQITGNLTFCEGSSTVLTATATGSGNSFSWSNGITGPTNTITTPGTYTATVTTPSGCQYQTSVTVNSSAIGIANITQPGVIDCNNTQVTLNASTSIINPESTFSWSTSNGGNIISGINTLTPTVNNGGSYTLTITNTQGCSIQSTVNVIENTTPPTITITSPTLSICKGDSITLSASGASYYNWNSLPGTGNTQTVSPTSTTTYTVTGIGSNGCNALNSASITINVVPEITGSLPNIEICKGETATLDAGSGTNYTYLWNTGETSQIISTSNPGTYTVTINNNSCSKILTAIVSITKTPEITNVIYKDNTLTINVKNTNNELIEYSIDDGMNWQFPPTFNNILKNKNYSIRVRKFREICSTQIEYYTLVVSNIITPNNDGINDIIDFSAVSKFENFKGKIFNKYGKSVFEITMKNAIWRGNNLGNPLPTDTYWYILSWYDKISKKNIESSGWILLKNRN